MTSIAKRTVAKTGVALAFTLALASAASAAEPAKCKLVRMSDPGWSDISATNGVLATVLKGLGYEQKVETLAVPVTYKSVGDGLIDVFLGNWMPAFSTALLGLALSERDGILLLIGGAVGVAAMAIVGAVVGAAGFATHFAIGHFSGPPF